MPLQILTYSDYLLYKQITEENYGLACSEPDEPYYLGNEISEKIEINNKHDKCFRDVLSDKSEITNFLKHFINPENTIKPEDIEAYNTSFITSKYQNREADIVYKIKGKNAFILIEHQSKIDKKMPYRLIEYYTEILRTTKENDEEKMPIVIPIIIYTGSAKWNVNGYISEKQEIVEGYQEGRLDIKYNLVQANNFKTDELLSKGTMLANTMIIENSKDTDELAENLEKIIENTNEKEKLLKLKNIVKYILKGILEREDIEKIEKMIDEKEAGYNMDELIKRIKRNDKKKMKKIEQEAMKKGIDKGISQGITQGISQTLKNMAQKLLNLKMPIEQIMQVTGLTEEEIKSMQ